MTRGAWVTNTAWRRHLPLDIISTFGACAPLLGRRFGIAVSSRYDYVCQPFGEKVHRVTHLDCRPIRCHRDSDHKHDGRHEIYVQAVVNDYQAGRQSQIIEYTMDILHLVCDHTCHKNNDSDDAFDDVFHFTCCKGRHRSLSLAEHEAVLLSILGADVSFKYYDVPSGKHPSRLCMRRGNCCEDAASVDFIPTFKVLHEAIVINMGHNSVDPQTLTFVRGNFARREPVKFDLFLMVACFLFEIDPWVSSRPV